MDKVDQVFNLYCDYLKITLQDIGRRYNREWIFRHIDYTFSFGNRYAILGPNGSGKSTLLKVLSGSLTPSEGTLAYYSSNSPKDVEDIYQQIGIAAPYVELIEEFTLAELIDFHFKFKSYLEGFNVELVKERLGFGTHVFQKEIRHFSSGMKQRVKLVLACCSRSQIVFLDEPTSNLDKEGERWYLDLVEATSRDRLLIVGSNQEHEYAFCNAYLEIMDFK